MKTIYKFKLLFAVMLISTFAQMHAQVAIGKSTVTGTATLLDFAENTGVIHLTPTNGFDLTDDGAMCFSGTAFNMVFRQDGNNVLIPTTGSAVPTLTGTDQGDGVIIGADTTTATSGALVIESTTGTEAMILPKFAYGSLIIPSPEAGMLYYDTATKTVNFYNGSIWEQL